MSSAVFFQIQSFAILGLIYFGIYWRKVRKMHVKIMATAIVWDILLILQIEFTRSAIAKASKIVKNPMLLNIHVSLAVATVLFYFALIYTGRKLLAGQGKIRGKHKLLGWTAVVLRTLTLVTSFLAV